MSLTLTLVRHGESTDNLKSLWAGHRDAPLTTHGMNQARRLGKSFEDVYIAKIYASDLKRAHWTALQIATQNKSLLERLNEEDIDAQAVAAEEEVSAQTGTGDTPRRSDSFNDKGENDNDDETNELADEDEEAIATTSAGPSSLLSTDRAGGAVPQDSDYSDDFTCSSSAAASSPMSGSAHGAAQSQRGLEQQRALLGETVTTTPLLREQFFGLAEGQNWRTGYATSSNSHHNRKYKFEQGESLEDVHARAREIVERCVVPWLVKAWRAGRDEHVVLVAHGIMISELLFALSRLQDPRAAYTRQSGHTNTGWTRMRLTFPPTFKHNSASSSDSEALPAPDLPRLSSASLPPYYREPASPSSSFSSAESIDGRFSPSAPTLPKITIRQTHTNHTVHLNGLKRTKGGIGSEKFDERQSSLKNFFSGAASGASSASDAGASPMDGGTARTPGVPGLPIDLTADDKGNASSRSSPAAPKTANASHHGDNDSEGVTKRGIRIASPPSPSPKKGRLT